MIDKNNKPDIDSSLLEEIQYLAEYGDYQETREATWYLDRMDSLPGEWILGYGYDNCDDCCYNKNKALEFLLLLCQNITSFETFFKKAWSIPYTATYFDEHSMNAVTLSIFTCTKDLVDMVQLTKSFKAQIQHLDFETLFLRAVFDIIAIQFLRNNKTINFGGWRDLITLSLHPTQGDNVTRLLLTFNLKSVSTSRHLEAGCIDALNAWNHCSESPFVNRTNLERLLQYLKIPSKTRNELIVKCFNVKQLTPIVFFLKQTKWFYKSRFAEEDLITPPLPEQKSTPPYSYQIPEFDTFQEEIIQKLEQNISFLKQNKNERNLALKRFNAIFLRAQSNLSTTNVWSVFSSGEEEAMSIANFFLGPLCYQIFLDFVEKKDPKLLEIFSFFHKQICDVDFIRQQTDKKSDFAYIPASLSANEKVRAQQIGLLTKLFVKEAEILFDKKQNIYQKVLANYKLRILLFPINLTKDIFLYIMGLGFWLALGIGNKQPFFITQEPPIAYYASVQTSLTSPNINETSSNRLAPFAGITDALVSNYTRRTNPAPVDCPKQSTASIFVMESSGEKKQLITPTPRLKQIQQIKKELPLQLKGSTYQIVYSWEGYPSYVGTSGPFFELEQGERRLRAAFNFVCRNEPGITFSPYKCEKDHALPGPLRESMGWIPGAKKDPAHACLVSKDAHRYYTDEDLRIFSILEKNIVNETVISSGLSITEKASMLDFVQNFALRRKSRTQAYSGTYFVSDTQKPLEFWTTTLGESPKKILSQVQWGIQEPVYSVSGVALSDEHKLVFVQNKLMLGEEIRLNQGTNETAIIGAYENAYASSLKDIDSRLTGKTENQLKVCLADVIYTAANKEYGILPNLPYPASLNAFNETFNFVQKGVSHRIQVFDALEKLCIQNQDQESAAYIRNRSEQTKGSFRQCAMRCTKVYNKLNFSVSDQDINKTLSPGPFEYGLAESVDEFLIKTRTGNFARHAKSRFGPK